MEMAAPVAAAKPDAPMEVAAAPEAEVIRSMRQQINELSTLMVEEIRAVEDRAEARAQARAEAHSIECRAVLEDLRVAAPARAMSPVPPAPVEADNFKIYL
jgi:hypothetical protein